MRAPARGCSAPNFSRVAMRPGISCSASSISRRPKAARLMSATLYCLAGSEDMIVVLLGGCGRKRCKGRWRGKKKRTMGSEKGKVQLMYRRGAGQALGGSFSQANQAPRRQLRSLSAKSHLPTKGRSTLPLRATRLNPTEFLSFHRLCLFFCCLYDYVFLCGIIHLPDLLTIDGKERFTARLYHVRLTPEWKQSHKQNTSCFSQESQEPRLGAGPRFRSSGPLISSLFCFSVVVTNKSFKSAWKCRSSLYPVHNNLTLPRKLLYRRLL